MSSQISRLRLAGLTVACLAVSLSAPLTAMGQDKGSPEWNAKVVKAASKDLASVEPAKPTAPPEPEGMVKLFNGKDLAGWEGKEGLWKYTGDGVVRGEHQGHRGNTFLIWRGGEVKDFELRLSWRMTRGNAGVQYRSKDLGNFVVTGYQAECENTPGKAGFLFHEKGRGWLNSVGDKVEVGEGGKPRVVGQIGDIDAIAKTFNKDGWNDYVIIARGNHLVHYLNGVQTIDFTDNDPEGRLDKGVLALQLHGGGPMWIEYKDVRIKNLD